MKIRFKIQHKLLLGFILILLITVVLVAVTGKILFQYQLQQFLAENQLDLEVFRQAPEGRPPFGGLERIFLLFTGFGAVLATIMSFIFARYLVNPMERVIHATQAISRGNYASRIKIDRKDEIGDLCLAVNEMATELEKMEQIRRDLVSNVAHELATPLTNIGGYLRAINDGTIQPGSKMKSALHLVESEADRLCLLVEDVRALYLLDQPRNKLELRETDLNKLLKDVIKKMKPQLLSKPLKLKITLSEGLPKVKADPDKLVQVFINLISNAISYTQDKGHITVSTGIEKEEVFISVKDDGLGISEEDLPYIFERFYRVDKSRSRKIGGTGVGLTIVKELVEAHGGRVEVKSKLTKGSEFFIYLPI